MERERIAIENEILDRLAGKIFLLARLPDDCDGYALQVLLAPSRILIRVCDNFEGLDTRYVRFAVKEVDAIQQLEKSLKQLTIVDIKLGT